MWPVSAVLQAYAWRQLGQLQQARKKAVNGISAASATRAFHPVVVALPIAALLLVEEGEVILALELDALAQQHGHVARSRWFRDIAGRELEAAAAAVPPEVANAARERGERRELWETAAEMVARWSVQV
jgi:hypothetical protein